MIRLAICEKPSVAADVAKALANGRRPEKTEWGWRFDDLWVAAAAGHLVAELPPEKYDEKYKTWRYEDLPVIPERFMYQPRDPRSSNRLRQLAELIRDPQVDEIVNCCDAGREGELIFKLIVQYARPKNPAPVRRAWFSSMTEQAIVQAFANLRPDSEMAGLEAAARCRSEADWLVGMNGTRAATCTLGGGRTLLSVGRVQTPTLALIVQRDVTIDEFVPEPYHQVRAEMRVRDGSFVTWWRSGPDSGAENRFASRADAELVASRTADTGVGTVERVEVQIESVRAPKLFDLTDLQREANRRYGFTATRTLAAAQACYEEHKVLSYPRTDSRFVTTDMKPVLAGLVKRVRAALPELQGAADEVLALGRYPMVVNDAKVTDHHAIIVTDAHHDLSKLNDDQRKIYELVARRFLAALLDDQRIERTVVHVAVDSDGERDWWRAAGRRDLQAGWRAAWPERRSGDGDEPGKGEGGGDEGEDDGSLPAISEGDQVLVAAVEVVDRETKPPVRFTEAILLGAMATAGTLVDDDEAAEAMKERGLGTPATRASILERLVDVGYVERRGRTLRATDKGRGLILALGSHPLCRPDLTGEWEQRLRLLERETSGAARMRAEFSAAVRGFTQEICTSFKDLSPDLLAAGRRVLAACPMPGCDGGVIEGKKGYGCTSWRSREEPGCGFVLWKEQAGKKLTEAAALKQVERIRSGEIPAPQAARERKILGPCPRCDGQIVERPRSWGCTSWRSPKEQGCGYTLFKQNPDGSELDEEQATKLLGAGATNERPPPEVFAPCPRCDKELLDRGRFLGCSSWRSPRSKGCGTVVFKERNNVMLSDEELRAEIAKMVGTEAPKRRTTKKNGGRGAR